LIKCFAIKNNTKYRSIYSKFIGMVNRKGTKPWSKNIRIGINVVVISKNQQHMKSIYTLTVLLALGLISCTPELVPFTERVQQETGLSNNQLKKVQFYNSTPIVLYRELTRNTTEVVAGQIKMVDGRKIEEIVIAPNTPGVIVNTSDNRLGISFEEGSDRYLIFGENRYRSGAYTVLARDWQDNVGLLRYDGKDYKISRQSAATMLLINMEKLRDLRVNSRTAKGRTVGL
jgi:hypothetical protein